MEDEGRRQHPEAAKVIAESYEQYYDYLLDFVLQRHYSQDVAQDLVHETFLVILQKPERYLNCTNRLAWLFSVLRYRMGHLERDRQYALRLQHYLEKEYVESAEEQIDLKTLYGGVIDDTDLDLFIMYSVEDYSYDELCAKFNIEKAACRKRIQRIRARLRKALGGA